MLHRKKISPELFNKYRIHDERINNVKDYLNNSYGLKRIKDENIIEKEYQKFKNVNMKEDENERRRKKQQSDTIHQREIIENLVHNANSTLNKLKLDTLKTTKTFH
jgi:hypothetical protein